jgi:hypothetical protein
MNLLQTLPLREATVMSLSFIASYIFNNVEEIKSEDLTNEIIATHMSIIELLQVPDDDQNVYVYRIIHTKPRI